MLIEPEERRFCEHGYFVVKNDCPKCQRAGQVASREDGTDAKGGRNA